MADNPKAKMVMERYKTLKAQRVPGKIIGKNLLIIFYQEKQTSQKNIRQATSDTIKYLMVQQLTL